MAIYIVTTSNWNSAAFWSGITETGTGHRLDFSALDATYSVTVNQTTGVVSIVNGATTYTIGEAGVTGVNANFGGSTLLDYFTTISGAQSGDRVTGSAENELLDGNSGDDRMEAMAGDDTLYGNGGADQMDGGDGADILYGGSGGDELYGGTGADQIFGESDNDTIDAGSGQDFVDGGSGADLIYGGADADHIEGGWTDNSADTIYGGLGNDLIFGGGGTDQLFGEDGQDWIDGGYDTDLIDGGINNDRLLGDKGNDTIIGNAGADILTGGAGNDTLQGGEGADTIWGAAGDVIDGGETGTDFDTLNVSNVSSVSYSTSESGTVFFNSGGSLTFTGIENVNILSNNYIVDGTAAGDEIGQFYFDADGDWVDNDDALGGGEADSIRAGAGNDTVWANEGNDTIQGDAGSDLIYGGGENDTIYGGDGNLLTADDAGGADTIFAGTGNDYVHGEAGNDVIYGDDGLDTLSGNEGADEIDGGDGADSLHGGQGNDSLRGGNDNDLLLGDGQWYNASDFSSGPGTTATNLTITNSSDGVIELWWITDTGTLIPYTAIQPGDTYVQGTFTDHNWVLRDTDGYWLEIIAGAPNQTVNYGAEGLDDSLDGGAGNDILIGQFGNDTLLGGDGLDTLFGGDGNDSINGGSGADSLLGQAGNDTIVTGTGQDTVFGGAGNDSILANTGANDKLVYGEDGADTIFGSSENDTLDGGADADVIYAGNSFGLGNNSITGGETVTTGTDFDTIDLSTLTTGVTATYSGGEAGTITDGTDTTTFSEIERLVLTDQADVVNGGGGNEMIDAGGGDDTISTGTGNDSILGGVGNDSLIGGDGNDTVDGGAGNDYVAAFTGNDLLLGGDGNDTIFSLGGGTDTLDGGADADLISIQTLSDVSVTGGETTTTGLDLDRLEIGGSTPLTLTIAGAENGTITGSGSTITYSEIEQIYLGSGADTINAGTESAALYIDGREGDDLFNASATTGDNTLEGQAGNDTIFGGSGNEALGGGSGNDHIFGGAGNDSIQSGGDADTVEGGLGNDTIDGAQGDDLLDGGEGDDLIFGGDGQDTIIGGIGNDALIGGGDADTFVLTDGFRNDSIQGGETTSTGTDFDRLDFGQITTGGVDVTYSANETGTATEGTNTIAFTEIEAVTLTNQADRVDGSLSTSDMVVTGLDGNDSIIGGDGNDSVLGGAGNDFLEGGAGSDTLYGGLGQDTLVGGAGGDFLQGDQDSDLADYSDSDAAITIVLDGGGAAGFAAGGHAENDTIVGIDELIGSDFNDSLTGYDATHHGTLSNIIDGGAGDDTIDGLGGNDILIGGVGNDSVLGGAGNDTLTGSEGADSLLGQDGDDLLIGDGLASTTGGQFGIFALASAGTTGILNNGTFVFDSSAASTDVQVTDDETAFEDLNNSSGSTLDAGAPQVLTQDITIGSTTYLAGTSIHAIAQSDIVNETTGETGNAWLVQLGPTLAGNVYWSFDIAVNNGDQITWTSSNTPGVQDQVYANTTGLEYIDLVQADGQFLASNDTLVGGIGNDTLIGGVGDDSLVAGDGADSISGDGGSDIIDAGTGNDTVDAGDGNDQVFAWTGDDSVLGGAGSDTVFGQDGNDTIFGGIGNDYLDGDDAVAGADSIFGEDGDDTIIGDGGNDTLSGGSGNDQIFAGADDDIVVGGTGNDQLYGEGGNDSLDAGAGNDTVLGGDGNDTIIGFEGNDSVLGGAGDDVINTRTSPGTGLPDEGYGAIGNPLYYPADSDAFNDRDTVDGGIGNDSILTGDDNDVILGGDGADTVDAGFDDDEVYGDAGADSLEGNEGNDTISGGADGDVIYGDVSPTNPDYPFYTPYELVNDGTDLAPNNNADVLSGDGGNDTIYGQDDNDTISGGLGDDEIYGGIDNDSLIGDDGNDTIDGGSGNDYIDGGTGADLLYGGTGDLIGPNLIADGSFEGATPTSWGQVSNLPDWYSWNTASPDLSDDTGYEPTYSPNAAPTDGTNYVSMVNNGSGFQEGISQDLATPLVAGTTYTITLDAAAGGYNNTSPLGDNLQILLFGNETAGQVAGDSGLPAGVQLLGSADVTTDYNTGTMGTITISFTPTTDIATLSLSLEDPDFSGGFAVLTIDNVSLQENTALPGDNDTIIGGTGDDTIFGQDGDDSLSGGADNDIVDGGIGNDWLSGNSGNDTVRGGDGADSVFGAEGDDVMYGDAGNDSMEGWIGNDTMFGGTGDDYIDGAIGADSLEGGDGNDTLLGGSDVGNDTLRGGLGDDSLSAGGGDDVLDGGDGADILFAADGNDQLDGGAGNDTLDGWTGNDTITAGTGDDQITGGDGDDTFIYVAGDGVDTITDFNFGNSGTLNDGDITNNDRIDLSNFYDDIWELTADFNDDGILNQSNSNLLGGTVDYSNNASLGGGGLVFAGATGNTSSFTVENTGVVCFASGTRILTTEGERLIETLRIGDRIITRDNGVQTLRWIGKRDLSKTDLARNPKLHPIHLSPKLTGGDLPLIVSPQHGVVFNVDGEETLVRAIHLARLQGGAARVMHGCRKVSYFHIMFEDHQIVFANGAPSESFFPGHFALAALESDVRSEIYDLFPDLQHHAAEQSYGMQARSFARFSHLPDHLNALRGRSRHRSVPGAAIAAHAHRPNAVTQRQAAS